MRRLEVLLAVLVLLVSACGGADAGEDSAGTLFVNIASSPQTIGTGIQRVMFAVIDLETGEFVGSQFADAVATIRNENGAPLETLEAEFIWMIPNVRGLYVIYPSFPEPGLYQLTVQFGTAELGPFGINSVENPVVVSRGDMAPLSETRTGSEFDLAEISSDPNPEPSLYEMSVHDAIAKGPTVVVFATPKWCQTATCGPLLDQVKQLAPSFPDLTFVHVEVFEDLHVASFDELVAVPAASDWGLPSEPWVFVVDANGVVSASFEGAASGEELVAAFSAVSP